ncbi:MAG: dienelactone hydrolase family protein [Paracoccaceae bacterium]|nr:dienelactone hydrolase family protein [Paracoccaceae bacterium]
MSQLRYGRQGPAKGQAERLVIFLHGYGADGKDLLSLHEHMSSVLQGTAFVSPDAPEPCRVNPGGFQWFPIPWIDGTSEAEAAMAAGRAFAILDSWLDEIAREEGVAASDTAIVGFSQGTMMALHVAPRRPDPCAAIVGFSGRLLASPSSDDVQSRPPVLLLHGESDEMVPFDSMAAAESALTDAGFSVRTHATPNLGHGISVDGIEIARAFLVEYLVGKA